VRHRHLRWCLALAAAAAPELAGPEQEAWLTCLDAEHDNLRAAMGWCVQGGAAAAGLNLAVALRRYWELRGHLSEGRRWLGAALAAAGPDADPSVRAAALNGAGSLASKQGDHYTATALLTESLARYRGLDDTRGIADTLYNLATVAWQQSHYAQATAWLEEGLALYRDLGSPQELAHMWKLMGNVALMQGQHERAHGLYEEALALFQDAGDRHSIATLLYNLGLLPYLQGEAGAATARLQESLALSRELGHKRIQAAALQLLGVIAGEQGEYGQAGVLLEESIALARELGDRQRLADGLSSLGQVALAEGADGRAHALLAESMGLYREVGDQRNQATVLGDLASLAARRGEGILAGRLWGAAAALRAAIGAPLPATQHEAQERAVAGARSAVGEAAFAAAWGAGEALSREQAIAEALDALLPAHSVPGGAWEDDAPRDRARATPRRAPSSLAGAADAPPPLPAGRRDVAEAWAGPPQTREERQAWALQYLRTAGSLSPRAYATLLRVSVDTALRDLRELVGRGAVQPTGTTRDRRYMLAGQAAGPAIHRTAR
jgi:tetratricopeptide (TPR) repeat protein